MISLKMGGIIAVAFVAGAFLASPELRAYAANTVFSSDIVDGEVKSADIATNAVKSAEIATDAVGASELQGVTKLLFGQCAADSTEGLESVPSGGHLIVSCTISGVDFDDSAIASSNTGDTCFDVMRAETATNRVDVRFENECAHNETINTGAKIGIIVFDK